MAPPTLIAERKGELGVEEIARQVDAYAALAESDGTIHLLDGTRAPSEVGAIAFQLIASYRARNAATVGAGVQAIS